MQLFYVGNCPCHIVKMSTYEEKLSILAEMISFARVENTLKKVEYNFLLGVADQLGIDKITFESLFHTEVERILPKSQADRILQFHRLVLLMNVEYLSMINSHIF